MSDTLSKEERSRNMAAVKSKNTKPEIFFRKCLFAHKYRYRINSKNIPGHPDVWLSKYQLAIFINGCFWHQHKNCKKSTLPKTNYEFWAKKLGQNVLRDTNIYKKLQDNGIRCLIIWECTLKIIMKKKGDSKQLIEFIKEVDDFIKSERSFMEI